MSREKMLRERLRKWGINTKNKRIKSSSNAINGNDRPDPPRGTVNKAFLTARPLVPIPTNPKDVPQRRLLSTLDHYLESNWAGPIETYEGDWAVRIVMTLGDAVRLAAGDHSRAGWITLQNAEIELQQATWSRISVRNIVRMISAFGEWSTESNDVSRRLQQLVHFQLSRIIGKEHPLVLTMGVAIGGLLDVETCSRMLTVTDIRAKSKTMEAHEKAQLEHEIRLAYLGALWRCRELKMMEQALHAWSPVDAVEECERLWCLGKIKLELHEYHEAERLFVTARELKLDKRLHLCQLTNIAMGLFDTLMLQGRPDDAAEVFMTGLSCYDEQTRTELDHIVRALDIDWFRSRAVQGRAASAQGGELDPVIAKLESMSLDM